MRIAPPHTQLYVLNAQLDDSSASLICYMCCPESCVCVLLRRCSSLFYLLLPLVMGSQKGQFEQNSDWLLSREWCNPLGRAVGLHWSMNIYISDYSCVVCMSVCVRSFHLHLPLLVDTDATLENSSCSSAIYRKSAEHLLPTIKTRKYTHKRKNANTCSGNFVVDIDSTVQWLSVQIFFNT